MAPLRSQPRRPYQKRVDLQAYQRLFRFLRWMHPELSVGDVLRMLPEAEEWTEVKWQSAEALLTAVLACPDTVDVPTLATMIATGDWGWPQPLMIPDEPPEDYRRFFSKFSRQGRSLAIYLPGRPDSQAMTLIDGLRSDRIMRGIPVQLQGRLPTIAGLCEVAEALKDLMQKIIEQRKRAILGSYRRIAKEIDGRIAGRFQWRSEMRAGEGRVDTYQFVSRIQDDDFRVYAFYSLARLLAEGHIWRLVRCERCEAFFLKAKRDRPERPTRFCREACRRTWHNAQHAQAKDQG